MPRHWMKTSVKLKQGWEPGDDKGQRAFMPSSFPPHPSLDPKPCLLSPWGGGKLAGRAPCQVPALTLRAGLALPIKKTLNWWWRCRWRWVKHKTTVWPCVHREQQGHGFGLCQIQLAALFKLTLCLKQVQIYFPCKVWSTAWTWCEGQTLI